MRILSVISIKTYERYGYNYLRDIVLRRADYNEYKISEKDFKSLHPNDFEDLNILYIQGKLNHLPKQDKLGIERYQTKLNLEQPNWDASGFPFKEDYTFVFKPREVIYKDRDDNRKMMRIDEVHKSAMNVKKAECSNCKFLAEKIKTLEAKIKILEGTLEMERHPENHTIESAAILHELYNDMEKLGLE
ncbi:hypothetical protein Tco_0052915 [Tanacetum coccineum]